MAAIRTLRIRPAWCAALVVASVVIITAAGGVRPDAQDPETLLASARAALQAGKMEAALEFLNRAIEALDQDKTVQVTLQEQLRWERAVTNLNFSNLLSVRNQYEQYARRAHDQWKEYIEWYDALSPADRKNIPRQRILAATAHLASATFRGSLNHRQVLNDYKGMANITDFGAEAMDYWKQALYECPDWLPISDRDKTLDLKRRKVCLEPCRDDWTVYAATLAEWAPKVTLSAATRDAYLRDANQIRSLQNGCPSTDPGGGR